MARKPENEENNNNENSNDGKTESTDTGAVHLSLTGVVEVPEFAADESGEILIMATIKAPAYECDQERAPLNLVGIVDRSGSMQGQKLDLVKKTMQFVSEQMRSSDKLGIVSYDDNVRVDYSVSKMDNEHKNAIKRKIDDIQVGGCTNLCGGLVTGVNELKPNMKKETVSSALLFTDGLANVGPKDAEPILAAVRKGTAPTDSGSTSSSIFNKLNVFSRSSSSSSSSDEIPCIINTFGFGSDHDPNLLTAIAQKSNGVYYFIENVEKIPEAFGNCLGGLVSVVGQQIGLQVQTLSGTTIVQSYTKYTQETNSDKTMSSMRIGDIQGEEQKDILYKIKLPKLKDVKGVKEGEKIPIAEVTLNYLNATTKENEKIKTVISILRPEKVSSGVKRDFTLDVEWNRVVAATAMEEAVKSANAGGLEAARKIIDDAIKIISGSLSAADSRNTGLITDLMNSREKLANKQEYEQRGKHEMMTNVSCHWNQRQTDTGYVGQERYKSSAKSRMVSKTNNYISEN